jgi:hypothetical protein
VAQGKKTKKSMKAYISLVAPVPNPEMDIYKPSGGGEEKFRAK